MNGVEIFFWLLGTALALWLVFRVIYFQSWQFYDAEKVSGYICSWQGCGFSYAKIRVCIPWRVRIPILMPRYRVVHVAELYPPLMFHRMEVMDRVSLRRLYMEIVSDLNEEQKT